MGRHALKLETLEPVDRFPDLPAEIHEMSVTMKRIIEAVNGLMESNSTCWPEDLEELVRTLLSGRTTTAANKISIQFAIEKRKELMDLGAKFPLLLQVVNKIVAEDGHYMFQREIICGRLRQITHDQALAVLEKINATPDVDPIIAEIFKRELARMHDSSSESDSEFNPRISHTAIKKRKGNHLGQGRGRKRSKNAPSPMAKKCPTKNNVRTP